MTTEAKRNSRRGSASAGETATPPDPRAEYIAGLRALADLLEARPDLELPYHGSSTEMLIIPHRGTQRAVLAAWARALPGRKSKSADSSLYQLSGSLRGLRMQVLCNRDEVCEKRVLRTEPVTEMVPDPEALKSVPLVERTTQREVVEWVCTPSILADAPEAAAVAS